MRTTGLGGDSEVHVTDGLIAGLVLGPRRLVPVSLAAREWPALVHGALDAWLAGDSVGEHDGRFVLPMWASLPAGLEGREAVVAGRLAAGPARFADAVRTRLEQPALMRLVARGQVMIAGATPSDASHVLGTLDSWDTGAARKALLLMARRRNGKGERIAQGAEEIAEAIVAQLTRQTVDCLLETAFAEDGSWSEAPAVLARHPLTRAGFDGNRGLLAFDARLTVPVVGLGASAPNYYRAVGERLHVRMILPHHAGVANAIGAVVGQIAMHVEGIVTSPAAGVFVAHLPAGPERFRHRDAALGALEAALRGEAEERARRAGVEEMRVSTERQLSEIEIEGQPMFIEARLRVTAQGRPRIARG